MPISGLVVTLGDTAQIRGSAVEALRSDPRLTLGELKENRLPVVAETETIEEGRRMVREEIPAVAGVVFVDVVSVNFEDVTGISKAEGDQQ